MQLQQGSEVVMLATAHSSYRYFLLSVTEFTIPSFQISAWSSLMASHHAAVLKPTSKASVFRVGSLKIRLCKQAFARQS